MTLLLLFFATLFVAYANGANDNFKGVATLYGSGSATYRQALTLATIATLAGCLASVFLAADLVRAFSGKGIVPNAVAASPEFVLAVAIGAASTVILATVLAFPISTTHGLTGALVGAGGMAAGPELNVAALGGTFFLPLLLSPLIAVGLTMGACALWRRRNANAKPADALCVCFTPAVTTGSASAALVMAAAAHPTIAVGRGKDCAARGPSRRWLLWPQRWLTGSHFVSAGIVSFARGLNDTPKIVALMLVIDALDIHLGMLAVALAMAAGGWLHARKVAQTMSLRITAMSDGPAFGANLVTGLLVIAASRFGLPVSTTHVSVGAITGLGLANGSADTRMLRQILLSWLLTLPIAAAIAAAAWWIIRTAR
jgi:inorganic phosphate transporter, PiT family